LTASTWGYKNVTLQTTEVAFFSSLLIKHGHIVIEFSCSFKIKIYPMPRVFLRWLILSLSDKNLKK